MTIIKNLSLTSSVLFLFLVNGSLFCQRAIQNEKITIPVETITDKIRGGLLGQILGNLNGIEHEAEYIHEPGQVEEYIPALPEGARTDDDTDMEWVYIYEMQKNRNVFLPYADIQTLWLERINQRIWCSNRYARYLMDLGLEPPLTGLNSLNPWAEFNISGQFLSETFGLIAPAMPRTASEIALHYTRVAIDSEPAQTTQFFATMIATAFVEDDIHRILEAGMEALHPDSKVLQIARDILKWHSEDPEDWKKTRELLMSHYAYENGGIRDWNGVELNTGAIIAALLYGEGSFTETVRLAFNYGWDADCNAATVGTVLGVIYGYRDMMSEGWQIVDRYQNTTRDRMPENETITSFADRLIDLFEMVNDSKGGRKKIVENKAVYEINRESPMVMSEWMTLEDQKERLWNTHQDILENNLIHGTREDRARVAYVAIMLGRANGLSEKFPEQWKRAVYDLSGYWKVISNLFYGDFAKMSGIREKFFNAGLKKPLKKYDDQELWSDPQVWKTPEGLY